MREIYLRLRSRPGLTAELLLASLVANILGLALPFYVIQVLNRYLSYGVDATLFTLTVGVLLAVTLEWSFRQLRLRLAETLGEARNRELMSGAMGVLTRSTHASLAQYPRKEREELFASFELIETAYNANNIAAILDVPFALLFLFVLFLISPILGAVATGFVLLVFLYGLLSQRALRRRYNQLTETVAVGNRIVQQANRHEDALRLFDRSQNMLRRWNAYLDQWLAEKRVIGRQQGAIQVSTASLQAFMGVAIYAIGARKVLTGELNIGLLIGANILAFRALGPLVRFAQMGDSLIRAEQALERLQLFARSAVEPKGSAARKRFHGQLELRDIAFRYPGMVYPLYESMQVMLPAQGVLVVTGSNGAGKTTLARIITGLLNPTRGAVLADGVDIRQLAPVWWHGQLKYWPQEPDLWGGSLREVLTEASAKPLPDHEIRHILTETDLAQWVDRSEHGLDMDVGPTAGISLGYRRRIALARAMAVGGRLVVFDDPVEGLDEVGRKMVYQWVVRCIQGGHTLMILSNDRFFMKLATLHLDLDCKPVPKLHVLESANTVPRQDIPDARH